MLPHKLESAYKLAIVRGLYRIAARILEIEVVSSPYGAAYTDGSKIVFDPEFLERLDVSCVLFIAAHEYYHITYNHVERGRKNGFNPIIYNIASDLVINTHLTEVLNLPKPPDSAGGVFKDNPIFEGMPDSCNTSETIYRWLIENNKQPSEDDMMHDIQGGKSADDAPEAAARNHADRLIEESENLTKEILDTLGRSMPDDGSDWIDLLQAVRIETGRLVRREIVHNYARPSRRHEPKGCILPSSRHIMRMPRIDVYIDVSGSMEDSPMVIFRGLKSIVSHLAIYRPRFFSFNTEISSIDIKSETFSLGGGTDIASVLKKIKSEKSDLAILITDCEDNIKRSDIAQNVIIVSDNDTFADFYTQDWQKVKPMRKLKG